MKPSWIHVLDECLALVASPKVETVPRAQALGRILAEDIRADRDYPAADLSMMDGYAIGPENQDSYHVDGENHPGAGMGDPLPHSNARRIFTGAELPPGATRVIPQEMVECEGGNILIKQWPDSTFVRPRGQEARENDRVLHSGQTLNPVELGIMAGLGRREIKVTSRPRVGHLITGSEIISADALMQPGKIRDVNSDLVASFLAGYGFSIMRHTRALDDRDILIQHVAELGRDCDFLLISGGASVGEHDFARPALEACGFEFLAHGLNIRPGRPVGISRRGTQWAFALPGNPLSHLAVLRLLVLPLLQASMGMKECRPRFLRGTLTTPLPGTIPNRDTFWPAAVTLADGLFRLEPGRFLSSGDVIGLAEMNAFISLPAGKPVPSPDEPLNFLPLSSLFP